MRRLAIGVLFLAVACSGKSTTTGTSSSAGGGRGGSAASGGGGSTGGGSASGGAGGSAAGGRAGSGSGGGGQAGTSGSGGAGGVPSDAGSTDAGPGCSDEGGVSDGGVEDAIASACSVAVVRVSRIDSECSGAGGEHITFDVLEVGRGPALTRLHAGDHAYYPPPDGPSAVGRLFVAGIEPLDGLTSRPDNSGWCLVGLPTVDGNVRRFADGFGYQYALLPVDTVSEGTAEMSRILTGG